VKLLIDAQLPSQMVMWFSAAGYDAIHTLDLPDGNQSTDEQVIDRAEQDGRVVVSKDADFVNSHLLSGRPSRLLLVSTGNISNAELGQLLVPLIPALATAFQANVFVELTRSGIIVRG
jgi:predicted nuclease of predicted toxin-antitoxin system